MTSSLMSAYVAHLRALYMIHQNNHWVSSGDNFYGNHLLFQRLYEGAQEMVDEAAEKCIGIFGKLEQHDVSEIVEKYKELDPVSSSLKAEKDFQQLAKEVYQEFKEKSILTLGLDDLIMSQASKSEVHTYLLQQAIGKNSEATLNLLSTLFKLAASEGDGEYESRAL